MNCSCTSGRSADGASVVMLLSSRCLQCKLMARRYRSNSNCSDDRPVNASAVIIVKRLLISTLKIM